MIVSTRKCCYAAGQGPISMFAMVANTPTPNSATGRDGTGMVIASIDGYDPTGKSDHIRWCRAIRCRAISQRAHGI
jgi:hypothetical protein